MEYEYRKHDGFVYRLPAQPPFPAVTANVMLEMEIWSGKAWKKPPIEDLMQGLVYGSPITETQAQAIIQS